MLQSYYNMKVFVMLDKLLFGESYPINRIQDINNKIILQLNQNYLTFLRNVILHFK